MTLAWEPQFESMMRQSLRFLPLEQELRPDLNLATAGLDSLATIELLESIEEIYEIEIPDALIKAETFATPTALWSTIADLCEQHGTSQPQSLDI
ncbi:phosphopantetheine-binding protein [Streptomyces niveiscabiei]|uniref:phosphopantetheine-binding protein n=1 Tax=Streptomyces niveiscabiei TaxID=164115 RepID=UPI0006EBD96B|nr:phosphopantetheine-binding protein [Streptomyces niveiscabiei]